MQPEPRLSFNERLQRDADAAHQQAPASGCRRRVALASHWPVCLTGGGPLPRLLSHRGVAGCRQGLISTIHQKVAAQGGKRGARALGGRGTRQRLLLPGVRALHSEGSAADVS